MNRHNFEIHINDDGGKSHKEDVTGWRLNEFFACHKEVHWQLTHLPTGHRIPGNLRTRKDAIALAEFLIANANWDFSLIRKARGPHKQSLKIARNQHMKYNRKKDEWLWI